MEVSKLTDAAILGRPVTRVTFSGMGIHAINLKESVELAFAWVRQKERKYICFCNIRSIARSSRDSEIQRVFEAADLAAPDGMPLVWLLKSRGFTTASRVYGPDFLLAFCEFSATTGCRHAFYGGAPGVADRLACSLQTRFPGMRVVGVWSPPFRELSQWEEKNQIDEINKAGPDILWVALGAPR